MPVASSQGSSKEYKTRLVCPSYSTESVPIAHSILEQPRQTTHLVALAALIKAIPRLAYAHEMPMVC